MRDSVKCFAKVHILLLLNYSEKVSKTENIVEILSFHSFMLN